MAYPTGRLPFEDLTTIDERVDYVHDQVSSVQLALNKLLEKEELPTIQLGVSMTTKEIVLSDTFQVGQTGLLDAACPLRGKITQIIRHWPRGCRSLVDLAVGHTGTWMLPNLVDKFVALDNATPVTSVDEEVFKGEQLWARIRNRDAVNPHTITVTFVVEGIE